MKRLLLFTLLLFQYPEGFGWVSHEILNAPADHGLAHRVLQSFNTPKGLVGLVTGFVGGDPGGV